MAKLLFPVYEFRPLYKGSLVRYNNGKWTDDDGEYDIAFYTADNVFSFGVDLPYYDNILWSWCKDMQWGSYVNGHPVGNAWHYSTKDGSKNRGELWKDRYKHPNVKARDLASSELCKKKGVANGRGPQLFHYECSYIINGYVREQETGIVVSAPEILNCIYCGKHKPFEECSHIKKIASNPVYID